MKLAINALGKNRLKIKEPLAQHTYFKIGGPADYYYQANSAAELETAVKVAIACKTAYFILGGGSNILVSDKGFAGLVIKNNAQAVKTIGFQGKINAKKAQVNRAFIEAESGAPLSKLARYSIEEGLNGLHSFLSVPGTVGGGIFNNSHYRPEKDEFIGNYLHSALIIGKTAIARQVDKSYFKFAYDRSILQQTKEVVIKATFKLQGGQKHKIWQRATKLIRRRNLRQPIGVACSGCTFQNISQADAMRLATPRLTQSAGYLIDKAGLKGLQIGQAKVSDKHAAFIENLGGATAKDVMRLIDKIKATIFEKYGVKLKLEIFLVGDFD